MSQRLVSLVCCAEKVWGGAQGIYGCGAHSDYGVLTLLATDGTPGLQIQGRNGWVDVTALPGTIVVNLGDMLERWTNGMFKSTVHRVRNMIVDRRV